MVSVKPCAIGSSPPSDTHRTHMWGFRFDPGLHILLFGVVRELQAELGVELVSRPLVWSPTEVMLLLTDRLPRKAILDAAQRTALPNVLRQWLTYALDKRGVDRCPPDACASYARCSARSSSILNDVFSTGRSRKTTAGMSTPG